LNTKLTENKDFLAGLFMVVVGAVAFYMALDFPFGSARQMGPGYFPRVLAGILIAFGLWIGARGLRTGEKVEGVWGWRALTLISVGFVVFGWLMDHVGFIPSLFVMFMIVTLAGHEHKWLEVMILTVIMIIFAWAVFIYGLGLPYRLFWWD
jgi:putative tricarboxylic transport membrane protein